MHRCITFKTQITTNTGALAYNGLYGCVTEQINHTAFNTIQDGIFLGYSRMGAPLLPKIRHTYPTMMKLGTVIPYLRKTQKMYKSRDTSLEFCQHQHFFIRNQEILLHQEIQVQIGFSYIIYNSFTFSLVFNNCFNKHGYNFDDVSKNDSRPS